MAVPITGSIQTTYIDTLARVKADEQIMMALENWGVISDQKLRQVKNSILEKNNLQERIQYTQIKMSPEKSDPSLSKPDKIKGSIHLLDGREMPFYMFLKDFFIHVQRYPGSKYTNDKGKIQQACSDEDKLKYEARQGKINNLAKELKCLWSAFGKMGGDIPFVEIDNVKKYSVFRGVEVGEGFTLHKSFARTVGRCQECRDFLTGEHLTIMTGQKYITIRLEGGNQTLQADNSGETIRIDHSEYHKLIDHSGRGIDPLKIKKLNRIL